MSLNIAVDVGGTFTDLISLDAVGRIGEAKSLTTPDDPSGGIFDVLGKAGVEIEAIAYFVHG